jgi:arylsulfatase A-like enzyme
MLADNSREFWITGVLVCAVLFVGGNVQAGEPPRPNVLFIAVDDLNDWVGCMNGHPNARTPNIDRLASQGVLFTNAHCQAPICGPSRASLFTGLLPSTTGIYGQIKDRDLRGGSGLTRLCTFLPDYFERYGYETMAAGKLFHQGDKAHVFEEYGPGKSFGPKPKKRMHYDPKWFGKRGGTQTDWGPYPARDELMPDYKIAGYAVKKLKQQHDKPFFLAIGFCRPHVPWHVPQKWFDRHPVEKTKTPPHRKDDLDDVPEISRRLHDLPAMPTTEWAIRTGQWKEMVRAYLACVTFVDAQIKRVLDALADSSYADDTIVVLWSDHGYHLGEKNRFAKHALWDRATKMPLIIAGPGCGKGLICSAPVGLIDLYPTLVQLCGLPVNPDNEGHSLAPLLSHPDAAWPYAAITTYGRGNHAVQTRRYRFYQYADGSNELYDHVKDPHEWDNLAGKPGSGVIMARLRKHLPRVNARPVKKQTYPDNEYFEREAEGR